MSHAIRDGVSLHYEQAGKWQAALCLRPRLVLQSHFLPTAVRLLQVVFRRDGDGSPRMWAQQSA